MPHWNVHTAATAGFPANQLSWAVTSGVPLESSLVSLRGSLERTFQQDPEYGSGMDAEQFMQTFCILPAAKREEHLLDYEPAGDPIPWQRVADDAPTQHVLLRKQTPEDARFLSAQAAGAAAPAPDPRPKADAAADTSDIPRRNAVMVSGVLPMQQLTIGQLSWRAKAQKPSPGLHTRPVTTNTICPTCGMMFAMHVPEDLVRRHQIVNPDMEQKLNNALDGQRVVLESEKQLLGQEAADLRSALAAINASLARARDDEETLAQLQQQQKAWIKWLEQEIRQVKGEVSQVGADFEQCLASNMQLEGLVEQAISRRMETKYWGVQPQRRGAAVAPPAPPRLALEAPPADELPARAGAVDARRQRMRELVTGFYQRHNPAKLMLVDTLVDEYAGRERELLSLMSRKYGDQSILAHDAVIDGPRELSPQSAGQWSAGTAAPPAALHRRDPSSDKRLEDVLHAVLLGEGLGARRAEPPPLPSVPALQQTDVGGTEQYRHLHQRERDLLQQLNPSRAAGLSQPLAWGSPPAGSHLSVDPQSGLWSPADPPSGQWEPPGIRDRSTGPTSSSDQSKVTFDLRPQPSAPVSPTLREELLRVAPTTLARRQRLGALR
eukprot:TRINITY_DN11639_c0_g1_i1.p1 TRINITY_DN11639_c0_g1~~TRINITY_DN11639_c0_g1_i1.p1  ORF type:complete len:608 (+),score=161.07 TRINITY_DN11639_c0_g1_i1:43-1866(+)